ncbi:MAG: DUF1302 family protein [Cycloclasticus sp.]
MKKTVVVSGLLGVMLYSGVSMGRQVVDFAGGELEYAGYLRNETRYGIADETKDVTQNIVRLQLEATWSIEEFGVFDEFSISTVLRPEYDTRLHTRDRKVSYLGEEFNFANEALAYAGFDYAITPGLSTGGLSKNVTQGQWAASELGKFEVIANHAGNFPLVVPLGNDELACKHCPNVNVSERDLALNRNDSSGDLYPVKELFIDGIIDDWWLRLGKQQVVWGKTDFFRMQDIVNPMDFGQHFFLDAFEDIRIPQWAASLQYKAGDIGPFGETAITAVWNFDEFVPTGLGHASQAWAHPFAKQIGTFALFNTYFSPEPCVSAATQVAAGAPASTVCTAGDGRIPSGFGIDVGLSEFEMPEHKLSNTEFGGRFEFKLGEVRFALSHYYHWGDSPVFKFNSINLNTTANGLAANTANDALVFGLTDAGGGSSLETPITVMSPEEGIAFVAATSTVAAQQAAAQAAIDQGNASLFYKTGTTAGGLTSVVFDQVHTTGLSFDYFDDNTGMVFRVESSYSFDELVNNTYKADWVDTSDVFRFSLGIDRPTMIRALNPTRSFFLSAQMFNTHYLDYEGDKDAGFVANENNYIWTFFAQTQYMRDRLIPNAFYVYEDGSNTHLYGASIQYLLDNHFSVKGGIHVISGGEDNQTFDVGPFSSFTGAATTPTANVQQAVFGFAKEGIGALRDNDEIYLQLQYQF